MPIIRNDHAGQPNPHIYEIFFVLSGTKTVSYIGKSSGENPSYVSGSSELVRVIANTVLCYGNREAELGWHKVVLKEFPPGTPNAIVESEEKRLIQQSYEECTRLGPGRAWEILNKAHLGDIWGASAKTIMTKLRARPIVNKAAYLPVLDNVGGAFSPSPISAHLPNSIYPTQNYAEGLEVDQQTKATLEANFFQKASLKIGPKAPVSMKLMAYPGLGRAAIKMRVLYSVLEAIQRKERYMQKTYFVKTSTLKFILKEPNLHSARVRSILAEVVVASEATCSSQLTSFESCNRGFKFQLTRHVDSTGKGFSHAHIDYERFMDVASMGQQAAMGRRYFAINAANQKYLETGSGIPFDQAAALITGSIIPGRADYQKRKELHSSCNKALKYSEKLICKELGNLFATNYFTKDKLKRIATKFMTKRADFHVLLDNSETLFSDFIVQMAD